MYFSSSLFVSALVILSPSAVMGRKCNRKNGGAYTSNVAPIAASYASSSVPVVQQAATTLTNNIPAPVPSVQQAPIAASAPSVQQAATTNTPTNLNTPPTNLNSPPTPAGTTTPATPPAADLAAAADIKLAAQKTLDGIGTLESKEQQYGNMAASVDAGKRLITQIKILTSPGLTQADFLTCITALQKIDADGKAAEAAKKAEAKTNLGGVLRELNAAKADYKQNGPQPNMDASKQLLQSVINK